MRLLSCPARCWAALSAPGSREPMPARLSPGPLLPCVKSWWQARQPLCSKTRLPSAIGASRTGGPGGTAVVGECFSGSKRKLQTGQAMLPPIYLFGTFNRRLQSGHRRMVGMWPPSRSNLCGTNGAGEHVACGKSDYSGSDHLITLPVFWSN